MATGTVRWFNGGKGYGFIAPNDGGFRGSWGVIYACIKKHYRLVLELRPEPVEQQAEAQV